ncbi:hypothetical protein ACEWPL_016150 [Roseovarius sp. S1116L3]|uniref:hypothetical protein n=1 Tax=Roseovarius roseus TaxID=3342636 RepID=UPI00372C286E
MHRIIFLHKKGHATNGSKIMRCDQLCQLAREHIDGKWSFEVASLPHFKNTGALNAIIEDLAGSVVVFLKRAYNVFTSDQLERLGARARKLIVDHVDAPTHPLPDYPFDLHLCASIAGTHALRTQLNGPNSKATGSPTRVETLIHHSDPRIVWTDFSKDVDLRVGYFGIPKNTILPRRGVEIPQYDGSQLSNDLLDRMTETNVHYAVRRNPDSNPRLLFKPFTKGFNAAAAGAHVLVNRDVCDAVEHLGYDYPFFIEGMSEENISAGIERLRQAAGTGTWKDAFDAVNHTRQRSLPSYSARSLGVILGRLMLS